MKGDRFHTNQTDLVDVDAASGFMRGTTWLNIFSPRTDSLNLSLRTMHPDGRNNAETHSWIAWLGLQGGAMGGMNPRGANPTPWPEHYNFSPDLHAMLGVPIQVWSSKSFTGRWSASTAAFPRAELSEEGQSLFGSITNTLGFTLNNCIVVYDRWVYELGDNWGRAAHSLEPGESAVLDLNVKRSTLKTFLTGKKSVYDEKFRQEITPYDQAGTDTAYILRIMMFFTAIDGQDYTGMDNEYQTFVDMSDLLKTGRAILVAEGPRHSGHENQGATLLRDGIPMADPADMHLTLYRFVFPVKRVASAENN
jgi:hypothetical protein